MKYSIIKRNLIQQQIERRFLLCRKSEIILTVFLVARKKNRYYGLSSDELVMFAREIQSAEGNNWFYAVLTLFKYGYVKGYRACESEMKKGGAA